MCMKIEGPINISLGRVKRIWYLSPMRAAKVQASLRIRAVSPEPPLLAHTSSESRGTFRQKARSLAPLNDWACAVKIFHDGMLEDTNSLDGAHLVAAFECYLSVIHYFVSINKSSRRQFGCISLLQLARKRPDRSEVPVSRDMTKPTK